MLNSVNSQFLPQDRVAEFAEVILTKVLECSSFLT